MKGEVQETDGSDSSGESTTLEMVFLKQELLDLLKLKNTEPKKKKGNKKTKKRSHYPLINYLGSTEFLDTVSFGWRKCRPFIILSTQKKYKSRIYQSVTQEKKMRREKSCY